jgi:hypothetical protein
MSNENKYYYSRSEMLKKARIWLNSKYNRAKTNRQRDADMTRFGVLCEFIMENYPEGKEDHL